MTHATYNQLKFQAKREVHTSQMTSIEPKQRARVRILSTDAETNNQDQMSLRQNL